MSNTSSSDSISKMSVHPIVVVRHASAANVAHRVVAEVADQSTRESRSPGYSRLEATLRTAAIQRVDNRLDDGTVEATSMGTRVLRDSSTDNNDVAAPFFSTLHRFEKVVVTTSAKFQVGAEWCVEIRKEFSHEHAVVARKG